MANTHYQTFTIAAAKFTTNVTDFPTLFVRANFVDSLFDPAGSATIKADGGDLRLFSGSYGSGTAEPCEIVSCAHDSVLGADDAAVEIWGHVQGDTVAGATGYWEFGDGTLSQPAVTDALGRNAVWPTGAVVYHLNDDPGGGTATSSSGSSDGTANGTMTSADLVAGNWGKAWDFDGTDDDVSATNPIADNPTAFRVSIWLYPTSLRRTPFVEVGMNHASGSMVGIYDTNGTIRVYSGGGSTRWIGNSGDIAANAWQKLDAVYNTGTSGYWTVLVNGTTKSPSSNNAAAHATSGAFYVGRHTQYSGWSNIIGQAGLVIVEQNDRSTGWLQTEYTNQNDPATFTTAGTVTAIGGSPYTLTADAGSYTLTGTAAGLKATRKLAADAGSYTLTGTAAGLKRGFTLAASAGSYSLTGTAATLTYTPAATSYTLTAEAGSYTLTGTAAGLKVARKLAASAGSYSLTGTAAGLKRGFTLTAAAGSYTLTGTSATLKAARKLSAESGTYSLTGTAATLTYSGQAVLAVYAYAVPETWTSIAVPQSWESQAVPQSWTSIARH